MAGKVSEGKMVVAGILRAAVWNGPQAMVFGAADVQRTYREEGGALCG